MIGTMVAVATIVASCQMGDIAEPNEVLADHRDLVIEAIQSKAESQTRTVLVGGEKVYWLPSDAISVFCDGQMTRFESTSTESSASSYFAGKVPAQGREVLALYPYDEEASISSGYIKTSLPSEQYAAQGTFANELLIIAGKGNLPDKSAVKADWKLQMPFQHVCSGVRFSLKNEGIKSVTISAIAGEPIAGTFTFYMDDAGIPTVRDLDNPSSSITMTVPGGGTFKTGVWYYFVTLPVSLDKGLTFTVSNGTETCTRTYDKAIELERGVFKQSTLMDQDMTFSGGGEDNPDVEVQVAGPDTWVAVDELQRSVNEDAPSTRSGKQVLMFYWTWHCESHADYPTIVDITGVQGLGGSYINDYTSYVWGVNQGHDPCFWGTPLFGYYRSTDPWVLRKHAEMLADAGVDAVFFDNSNGTFMWWSAVTQLLETWSQAKSDGVNVPKIAFLLPFSASSDAATQLRYLYSNLYGKGLYKDLWFMVDGKPCVMAYPSCLTSSATDQAIKNFFTFRPGQGDYVFGDQGGQWGWLEVAPQHLFNGEQMTVSVAQNATAASQGHCYAFNAPGSYGRSYTKASGHSKQTSKSYIYGYNFQEQWDRAIAVDPNYVFVTGWNEWTANRQDSWPVYSYCSPYANAFPDQYDSERSRDIEPNAVWGDNGDNYYYQLIKNVRRYKGVGNYPNVSKKVTMDIDGDFSAWEKVSPDFRHYAGNTLHRNHAYQSTRTDLVYTNATGRNDFVDAKVARDEEYIYFYIETADDITSRTDEKWMRLLINIDRNWKTGWKGYDFCLNYRNPASATKGYVSKCKGTSWSWSDAGTFDYSLVGNKMEIRVSRSLLGVASDDLDFEFKWSDNMQEEGKILDFYSNGDCAPGGRFNFHYKEK